MSKTSTERIALGINIGHDRSAAIIKNGEVLGVVAQREN